MSNHSNKGDHEPTSSSEIADLLKFFEEHVKDLLDVLMKTQKAKRIDSQSATELQVAHSVLNKAILTCLKYMRSIQSSHYLDGNDTKILANMSGNLRIMQAQLSLCEEEVKLLLAGKTTEAFKLVKLVLVGDRTACILQPRYKAKTAITAQSAPEQKNKNTVLPGTQSPVRCVVLCAPKVALISVGQLQISNHFLGPLKGSVDPKEVLYFADQPTMERRALDFSKDLVMSSSDFTQLFRCKESSKGALFHYHIHAQVVVECPDAMGPVEFVKSTEHPSMPLIAPSNPSSWEICILELLRKSFRHYFPSFKSLEQPNPINFFQDFFVFNAKVDRCLSYDDLNYLSERFHSIHDMVTTLLPWARLIRFHQNTLWDSGAFFGFMTPDQATEQLRTRSKSHGLLFFHLQPSDTPGFLFEVKLMFARGNPAEICVVDDSFDLRKHHDAEDKLRHFLCFDVQDTVKDKQRMVIDSVSVITPLSKWIQASKAQMREKK